MHRIAFVATTLLASTLAASVDEPKPSADANQAYAAFVRANERLQLPLDRSNPNELDSRLLEATARAKEFYSQFPEDPRSAAVAHAFAVNSSALSRSAERRRREATRAIDERLGSKQISDAEWQQLKFAQASTVITDADRAVAAGHIANLQPLRQVIDEFAARLPASPLIANLESHFLRILGLSDPNGIEAALLKLADSPNERLSKYAQGRLRIKALTTQPLNLRFTAIDGREVDMEKLRGKVVLLDFWATWCGPCVAELPHIRKMYDRYHRDGFEVVGISCDFPQDAKKLAAFVRANELPWPQHHDSENRWNHLATKFGVISVPQQLLFDRTGRLVVENARGATLESALERLMQ
jgi:thiol-disulfide isomerase/thioredoxin